MKITDQRFGEAIVTVDAAASIFKIRANPMQTARLQLFNAKLGNHSVRVDIYSTSVVPSIPAEASKARVKAGPFSFVIDTGPCDSHGDGMCSIKTVLSWDYDEHFTLAQIGDAARAMLLMCSSGTRVSLLLSVLEETSVDFWLSAPPTIHENLWRYLKIVEAAAVVSRYVGLETVELASGKLDHLPWTALLAGRIVEGAIDTELRCPVRPVRRSKKPVLVVSCAFPLADWVIFTCGALPLRMKSRDHSTFSTEHAQNLGVWKVPIEEAKDFPILEKQAAFVEQLEMDAALEVFSVDPRTDKGMNALMSGATAKDPALN